jgi:hypothetical protein
MHPTRNSAAFILNLLGGRVMPGVRSAEGDRLRTRGFQPVALSRSNKRMHATTDTSDAMLRQRLGAARDAQR